MPTNNATAAVLDARSASTPGPPWPSWPTPPPWGAPPPAKPWWPWSNKEKSNGAPVGGRAGGTNLTAGRSPGPGRSAPPSGWAGASSRSSWPATSPRTRGKTSAPAPSARLSGVPRAPSPTPWTAWSPAAAQHWRALRRGASAPPVSEVPSHACPRRGGGPAVTRSRPSPTASASALRQASHPTASKLRHFWPRRAGRLPRQISSAAFWPPGPPLRCLRTRR